MRSFGSAGLLACDSHFIGACAGATPRGEGGCEGDQAARPRKGSARPWAVFTSVVAFAALSMAGCSSDRGGGLSWRDRSILPPGQRIPALNSIANDRSKGQEERARAVFTLFARHIRPGSSAEEAHRALLDLRWLKDSQLRKIVTVGGWLPVEWTSDNTVFQVDLFPNGAETPWSPWVIYFSLSGRLPNGRSRSEDEALEFLHGSAALYGNPKVEEFALCFPADPRSKKFRIERFSRRGMHVSYP